MARHRGYGLCGCQYAARAARMRTWRVFKEVFRNFLSIAWGEDTYRAPYLTRRATKCLRHQTEAYYLHRYQTELRTQQGLSNALAGTRVGRSQTLFRTMFIGCVGCSRGMPVVDHPLRALLLQVSLFIERYNDWQYFAHHPEEGSLWHVGLRDVLDWYVAFDDDEDDVDWDGDDDSSSESRAESSAARACPPATLPSTSTRR